MSRARGGHGRRVLRPPGGPVDLDRHPAGGGSRVDQAKRGIRAGAGEQPRALADNHGVGEQGDLVDKLVVQQLADQAAAAVHLQLTRRLGFPLADGRRDVTGQDGRVRLPRFGERSRRCVLGPRVQRRLQLPAPEDVDRPGPTGSAQIAMPGLPTARRACSTMRTQPARQGAAGSRRGPGPMPPSKVRWSLTRLRR